MNNKAKQAAKLYLSGDKQAVIEYLKQFEGEEREKQRCLVRWYVSNPERIDSK